MKTKIIVNGQNAIFGPVRLSHAHLMTPKAHQPGDTPKYSVCPLIDKKDTALVEGIRKAIDAAYQNGVVQKWGGKRPPFENWPPLIDGDKPNKNGDSRGAEAAGHWLMNAKSTRRPGLVDKNGMDIFNAEDVYSGMWALVSVAFYAYESNGSRGVAVAINNVKKVKDDTAFAGGSTPQQDFADFTFEDDDL